MAHHKCIKKKIVSNVLMFARFCVIFRIKFDLSVFNFILKLNWRHCNYIFIHFNDGSLQRKGKEKKRNENHRQIQFVCTKQMLNWIRIYSINAIKHHQSIGHSETVQIKWFKITKTCDILQYTLLLNNYGNCLHKN